MQFLVEHKWAILVSLEVLAWSATFFMFYARYVMRSPLWFRIGVVLFTATGVIPQICLGILNFIVAKTVDAFTLAIILLILYGTTIGKKHVQKLDGWVQAKFSQVEERKGR